MRPGAISSRHSVNRAPGHLLPPLSKGICPFILAGSLLHALGATGGAIVGGGSGLVAGTLANSCLDPADAHYHGHEVERGAFPVAAAQDGTPLNRTEVEDAFRRFHGRFANRTTPLA